MNTVKRKANVGERILITDVVVGAIEVGDIGVVTRVGRKEVRANFSGKSLMAWHEEYEVITEASEVKVKSLKEIVGSLVDCGYTCEAGPLVNNVDFQMLAEIAGYPTGGHAAVLHKGETIVPVGRTPQEIRDVLTRERIIEQAKRDVAGKLTNKPGVDVPHMLGYGRITLNNYSIEFIVNNEKRTVVALIRGNVSKEVRAKGIAKCAPTDCFNAHIGKAIAVRRALGLEVPEVYLRAPQPTEVRVGDVVTFPEKDHEGWHGKICYRVDSVEKGELTIVKDEIDDGLYVGTKAYATFGGGSSKLPIIDDTRENEPEVVTK
ncbi:hypothetical protein [Cytobacillus massiliigabonensis]|uniref:hypothetical protein n=1 Tax=Cytobacillus massiliigabonensis TaxID=1871011 RepID=UPI000C850BAB|nr:hypothetical protein [Cytobacillus massiliigabonensis]